MEESLCTCEVKVQKLNNEGDVDVGVDRISNLPDEIISCIFNSLDRKDGIKTSVLSKRWRHRWASFSPNLTFFDEYAPYMSQKRSLFMDYVERVIALRGPFHGPCDLDKFELSCAVFSDASRINSWVYSAIKLNVQDLFLHLYYFHQESFKLPHLLFTCDTLKRVVIMACMALLKLPSSIHFSNLKFLSLQYVVFPHHHSTQRLFSGLPVLEDLSLISCRWWNVKVVTIALPMLETLNVMENEQYLDNCRFFIIAEKLKTFNYQGALRNDYCFYDSLSLISGAMCMWSNIEESSRQKEAAYRAHRLLRGISCVKELMMTSYMFEVLTYANELYACMPILYKLTGLAFVPPGTPINFEGGTLAKFLLAFVPPGTEINFGGGTLAKFLQRLPCLESLIFLPGICLSGNHEDRNWILDPVPSCFSTHLRFIKIFQFRGTNGEMQVLKSLLKNCEMLLSVDIIYHPNEFSGGSVMKSIVPQQLERLPRASMDCRIKIFQTISLWGSEYCARVEKWR